MIRIFKRKQKEQWLEEKDLLKLGFQETLRRGHYLYFKRGKMTLKWDFHVEHRLITIKWGRALRFFGNVETKEQLVRNLELITKYFG